jgi:DNA-binding response OmpR family regulator
VEILSNDCIPDCEEDVAIKIAVIDDSILLNRWLEANLLGAEFEVKTLSDSSKAEEFIREVQPDVLLLDVLMPDLGGDEICKQIKGNPSTRHITVLFHSNVPEEILKDLVAQCQADGYIVKSDDPTNTARKIRQFLDSKTASE